MNKTIHALSIKLKWQLHELSNKLRLIEQQLVTLEKKRHSLSQKISNSSSIPAIIIPEQEIARSHFILQQQQAQDKLMISKASLQSDQQELIRQQTHLNTELKMLEKHQEAILTHQRKINEVTAQRNSDDYYLFSSKFQQIVYNTRI